MVDELLFNIVLSKKMHAMSYAVIIGNSANNSCGILR